MAWGLLASGAGPRTKTGLEPRDEIVGGSELSRTGWGVTEVRIRNPRGREVSRIWDPDERRNEPGAGSIDISRAATSCKGGKTTLCMVTSRERRRVIGFRGGSMDMVRLNWFRRGDRVVRGSLRGISGTVVAGSVSEDERLEGSLDK